MHQQVAPPLGEDATKEQRDERKAALAKLPLIEVKLKIRDCDEDELDRWMRERYGTPIESKSTRQYWKTSFLWAAALMPSEPGRCLVHFLPLSENAEIERIKQKEGSQAELLLELADALAQVGDRDVLLVLDVATEEKDLRSDI